MKAVTNLIIFIVSLMLAGCLVFSVFTVAKNIFEANSENGSGETNENEGNSVADGSGETDENEGNSVADGSGAGNVDPDAETWTFADGDIRLYCVYNYDKNHVTMTFAMENLDPGRYEINWSFKGSLFDTGVNFLPLTSQDNKAYYGFIHNRFYESLDGNITDENSHAYGYYDYRDLLTEFFIFDVDENGEFSILLLRIYNTSMEDGGAIRDVIMSEHINHVVLTKVG